MLRVPVDWMLDFLLKLLFLMVLDVTMAFLLVVSAISKVVSLSEERESSNRRRPRRAIRSCILSSSVKRADSSSISSASNVNSSAKRYYYDYDNRCVRRCRRADPYRYQNRKHPQNRGKNERIHVPVKLLARDSGYHNPFLVPVYGC